MSWTTIATDNFDRANGPIGDNWTPVTWSVVNAGGLVISNNTAIAQGSTWQFSASIYTAQTPSYNQRVTATTVVGSPGAGYWVGLHLSWVQPSADDYSGYWCELDLGGVTSYISRYEHGVETSIVSIDNLGAIASGTPVRFSIEGTSLLCELYTGGAWTTRLSGTDNNPLATGGTGGLFIQRYGTMGWNDFILESATVVSVTGATCWGHSTGVTETNTRGFTGNWTGTGTIEGSGDNEQLVLGVSDYMVSEVIDTAGGEIELDQNHYVSGDTGVLKWRTGASPALCEIASWNIYTGVFSSLGFVQIRVENS